MKSFFLAYYLSVFSIMAFPGVKILLPGQQEYFYVPDGSENPYGSVTYIDSANGNIQSTREIQPFPVAFGLSPKDVQPTYFGQSVLPPPDGVSQFRSDTETQPGKSDETIAFIELIRQKIQDIENDLGNFLSYSKNKSS